MSERPNRNAAIYAAVQIDRRKTPALRRGCGAIASDFGISEPSARRIHAQIESAITNGDTTEEAIQYLADAYFAEADAETIKEESN